MSYYTGLKETNAILDWYCYNLAEMHDYDLDSNNLIIGEARSGKSTLLLWIVKRFYQYRALKEVKKIDDIKIKSQLINYIYNNLIYSQNQDTNKFKDILNDILGIDEAYFIFDRRESMKEGNINITKLVNAFANNNNTIFSLIQDLTDLDSRATAKAKSIFLDYQRGEAYEYVRNKPFPIIKEAVFERFIKKPYLLRDPKIAKYMLKRISSYCGKAKYTMMNDEIFNEYKRKKKEWQAEI